MHLMLTDRKPDVNVSLYSGILITESNVGYTVLEGQVFGIECKTLPQFGVNWYNAYGVEG